MSREPRILRFSPPCDEPQLTREERRAQGVYYTPPEIVRWIVSRSLQVIRGRESLASPASPFCETTAAKDSRPPDVARQDELRILDPSCGAGAFLREANAQAPDSLLTGIDTNPISAKGPIEFLRGDFLASSFAPDSFDLILGNPPYLNIRQLAKFTSEEYRQNLRQRFKSARGNFDLYVLFLEKSLALLKPSGVCGMIIPNKWAGLDYAQPLRALLLNETTLCDIVDLSSVPVFVAAEVYPQILIVQKSPPARNHAIRVREIAAPSDLQSDSQPVRLLPQSLLSAKSIILSRTLDLESRVPTEPLGQRVRLHSGASGYTAGHMAELLEEAGELDKIDGSRHRPFIVSGNIDRYSIRLGDVRYMQRRFRQPVLDLDSDSLSPLKKKLYSQPKIVIAGMSRRIEAAYDGNGLALGVQVYAAAEPLDDPFYLLALLNSRLMSFLFLQRFAAKKLAGGYLAMNKGQLQQLPIRVVEKGVEKIAARLQGLARDRQPEAQAKDNIDPDVTVSFACASGWCQAEGQAGSLPHDIDREIDDLVYKLYRLTAAEIREVEASFEERSRKVA